MYLINQNGDSVAFASMVFFGVRFNPNKEGCNYDHDNFLINKEELMKKYNCDIFPIDSFKEEMAVGLIDCTSIHHTGFPFYASKKLNSRVITDEDLKNLKDFTEFIGVEYVDPAWRHCLVNILITKEEFEKSLQEFQKFFENQKKKEEDSDL
jgi:hypothetical protein